MKITAYNKAILPKDTKDVCKLTNLELLVYAIALGNCKVKEFVPYIELSPAHLRHFISVPNKQKISTLISKGLLEETDEIDVYKIKLPDSINKTTYSKLILNREVVTFKSKPRKYKDSDILVYGVVDYLSNTLGRAIKCKEINNYIRCDKSTINKILAKLEGVRYTAKKTKAYKGGREFEWHTNTKRISKTDHRHPDYIMYRYSITMHENSLNKKLLLAYCYSMVKKKFEPQESVIRHLTGGQYGVDKALEFLTKYKSILNSKVDKATKYNYLRIPLYSEYSSEELAILSMASEYKLRRSTCIWSLKSFKKIFNLPTSRSHEVCKKLLKSKALSKPSDGDIRLEKTKTKYDIDKFIHAVTVRKDKNIVLKYCDIKRKRKKKIKAN